MGGHANENQWSPGQGAKVLGVALTDDDSWAFPLPDQRSAFALIAAGGLEFGMVGPTRPSRSADLPVQGKTVCVAWHLN
jgi:hypothetical protein